MTSDLLGHMRPFLLGGNRSTWTDIQRRQQVREMIELTRIRMKSEENRSREKVVLEALLKEQRRLDGDVVIL